MAHKKPQTIRKGRFEFRTPALLLPRARLYADRLELSGWRLKGRFYRIIPLRQVLQIDAPGRDELLIWLSIGETLHLHVEHASKWKTEVEAQQLKLEKRSNESQRRTS